MPSSASSRPPVACAWLHQLAAGYLLGPWKLSSHHKNGLWGYTFERRQGRVKVGFFVGFLTSKGRVLAWTQASPPECLVFAFAHPVSSSLHQQLVEQEGSVFRRAYELLTKYTVRRPRFVFNPQQRVAIARHVPLAQFPPRERAKYARNFFIESLTILVRTRLPAILLELQLVED